MAVFFVFRLNQIDLTHFYSFYIGSTLRSKFCFFKNNLIIKTKAFLN